MIKIKDGVEFKIFRSEIYSLFSGIDRIFEAAGVDCVITCGTDAHGPDDPHTHGFAIDLRSKHLDPSVKQEVWQEIQALCGDQYTVLFENPGEAQEHFHLQIRKNLWREKLA